MSLIKWPSEKIRNKKTTNIYDAKLLV